MIFDRAMGSVVATSIVDVCSHNGWVLHAAYVRTNHAHVLLSADAAPEALMNVLKAWATRRLREAGLLDTERRVWTRHGSTRYVNDHRDFGRILDYVVEGQGEDLGGLRVGVVE